MKDPAAHIARKFVDKPEALSAAAGSATPAKTVKTRRDQKVGQIHIRNVSGGVRENGLL